MATQIVPALTSARTAGTAPRPLAEDWYTAAARAEHDKHCASCRELSAASEAAAAENGASMRRRDRIQLGLDLAPRKTVQA